MRYENYCKNIKMNGTKNLYLQYYTGNVCTLHYKDMRYDN